MCPLLVCAHYQAAQAMAIPMVQYGFVTFLVAFLINYTGIIRKNELMPFLPSPPNDAKLKRLCVCALFGLISALIWGWNGSAGLLFAFIWEYRRQDRKYFNWYMLLVIIAGSLLMEEYYKPYKLLEFLPGLLFGYIAAEVPTLKESSPYAMAHQFLFLNAIVLPMLFPGFHVIVPNIWQWIAMLIGGLVLLVTVVLSIKLMQDGRLSVLLGVTSGIIMIGTSSFGHVIDWVGAGLILVGIVLLIKKQYFEVRY